MSLNKLVIGFSVLCFAYPAYASDNANAGRQLTMRSCTSCHAGEGTSMVTDGAPPLSVVARDNKHDPAWIRGWLMDPHPPMPGIMLSRQQIDDVIAYLDVLSDESVHGR